MYILLIPHFNNVNNNDVIMMSYTQHVQVLYKREKMLTNCCAYYKEVVQKVQTESDHVISLLPWYLIHTQIMKYMLVFLSST